MARHSETREDLIRDATALVERAELCDVGSSSLGEVALTVGFRRCGSLSLYYPDDVAFHFNSQGELRRAFFNAWLWKGEARRLYALERVELADATELRPIALTETVQRDFQTHLEQALDSLETGLKAEQLRQGRCAPAGANLLPRLLAWLAQRSRPITIADVPFAR